MESGGQAESCGIFSIILSMAHLNVTQDLPGLVIEEANNDRVFTARYCAKCFT